MPDPAGAAGDGRAGGAQEGGLLNEGLPVSEGPTDPSSGGDTRAGGDAGVSIGEGDEPTSIADAGVSDGDSPNDASCIPPEPPPPAPTLAGTAFVFSAGPNSGAPDRVGLCSFPNGALGPLPRFYGGVESRLMQGPAGRCGACLRARSADREVDITIIDLIEPNPLARGFTLAMDREALRALSGNDDNLDLQFTFVPCENVGTIQVKFNGARDPSVLLLGHRNPVVAVSLLTLSGEAVELTRQPYNYWTPPAGFVNNGGTVSLALSDDQDNRLVLPSLQLSSAIVDTGQQFPSPDLGCRLAD